jgi:hypothetical protein
VRVDNGYYTHHGRRVCIPRVAEVSAEYRPGGWYSAKVQQLLNEIPDGWSKGEDPCETAGFPDVHARERVVAVPEALRERVFWAVHRRHKASDPQISPFIPDLPEVRSYTNLLTVELSGSSQKPYLVRVHPGDYVPPLYWMSSAKSAIGGKRECKVFWRSHAYAARSKHCLFFPETVTSEPPDWFTKD